MNLCHICIHSLLHAWVSRKEYLIQKFLGEDPGRTHNYIVIQHGNGIENIYCHLSKFLLHLGDLVFAGDNIAISGDSGAMTSPHLHFAIKENGKFIDPLPLLKAIVGYNNKQTNNQD